MKFRQIFCKDIVNLITMFYYKNDHLRYQILLHLTGGRTFVFGEYGDYQDYKNEFEKLETGRKENVLLQVPETQLVSATAGK